MRASKKLIKQKPFLSQITLLGFIVLGMWAMIMPSCVHDPFSPIDPGPIDTTGTPIDTNMNPVDTVPADTIDGDTVLGTPCDTNVVYFAKDVLPILVSNCAKSGCHDVQSHKEGVILTDFSRVLATGSVRAFDSSKSKMYKSITTTSGENRMPPSPAQRLTASEIALIAKWIQQGAKDLTCDDAVATCDTVGVSYASYIAPVMTKYCVGCHSAPGTAPSGNLSLNSYNAVRAVALNGKLVGAISWTAGYQQMPQGLSKLTDCRINKIKAWVNDGAPNN